MGGKATEQATRTSSVEPGHGRSAFLGLSFSPLLSVYMDVNKCGLQRPGNEAL